MLYIDRETAVSLLDCTGSLFVCIGQKERRARKANRDAYKLPFLSIIRRVGKRLMTDVILTRLFVMLGVNDAHPSLFEPKKNGKICLCGVDWVVDAGC